MRFKKIILELKSVTMIFSVFHLTYWIHIIDSYCCHSQIVHFHQGRSYQDPLMMKAYRGHNLYVLSLKLESKNSLISIIQYMKIMKFLCFCFFTFYFIKKNLFSNISRRCVLPNMIKAVPLVFEKQFHNFSNNKQVCLAEQKFVS